GPGDALAAAPAAGRGDVRAGGHVDTQGQRRGGALRSGRLAGLCLRAGRRIPAPPAGPARAASGGDHQANQHRGKEWNLREMETGIAEKETAAERSEEPRDTGNGDAEREGSDFTPVFILGSGRSGSTLLYKMLCLHPEIAYISNWDARFPGSPLCMMLGRLTRGRYALNLWSWFDRCGHANDHDRSLLRKLVPTPVEGEPFYRHCGVPLTAHEPPVDPE